MTLKNFELCRKKKKELLLKDLCARLPYGVQYKDAHGYKMRINIWSPEFHTALNTILYDKKPSLYLRPMSSMTEEEKKEYDVFCCKPYLGIDETTASNFIDWLNKKHFDYRGLIEKSLALEAPGGMYVIK